MDSLREVLNNVVLNPKYADILAIAKAARSGAVYGAKVRFPHALVMVFLFRSGSFREKLRLVIKATRQHARNLASFATVYKLSMLLLRYLPTDPYSSTSCKEGPYDTFVAGLIGGYTVFGRGIQSSVNQQIVIYVFARVMIAMAKLMVKPLTETGTSLIPDPNNRISNNTWPIFASLSWACVMYVFRWHPDTIPMSLRSSMKYIYVDSDHWDSFRTFLIHNR
ncbi:MAG: hypothetical protein M1827_006974 [Pycnora praestabilis]|nr:MAG: hypothetical protein M1827_006974 [Pycnora praestabilis]